MKPLILVTNDDGIHSPGLLSAAEAALEYGDILVVAPHRQQTGMGRAFPREKQTGMIEKVSLEVRGKKIIGYGVYGSPAFSVAHGVLELTDVKPDLCVSGINYGENIGMTLSCSGTVGAAIEAVSHGIPGIAASLEVPLQIQRSNDYVAQEWTCAVEVLKKWIGIFFQEGMPYEASILNINIPREQIDVEKYRMTRQSGQNYFEFVRPAKRDLNAPFPLASGLKVYEETLEKDSDIYALHKDRVISVTPLTCDMTAMKYLESGRSNL